MSKVRIRDFWRKYGGHLVLLVSLLWLVRGRMSWAVLPAQLHEETAVFPAITTTLVPTATPVSNEVPLIENDVSLPIVNDNSLAPLPNPHTYQAKRPLHNFDVYQVQPGDTPRSIAEAQGISPETLLGGNPWLSQESNLLQTGAELVVLPIDGVLHDVQPGETLESIAALYEIDVDTIIAYGPNNLEFQRLYPSTQLLIPGAQLGSFLWTPPKTAVNTPREWAVVGTGSFVWPVNGRCITNYYWYGHPGLDISASIGSPVLAADTGTVTYASWAAGTYYDYGNLIVINHGNGYETFYAHLSSIGVYPGQTVEKGEWIGATGNTGRSSGPHIHIEIRLNDFRDDPLAYLFGPTQNCT